MDQVWFFEKKLKFVFFVMVRSRYKLRLVFRLSLVCSNFKFKFFAVIQLFGLKTTSHVKSDLKNEFLRSGLPCEVVFCICTPPGIVLSRACFGAREQNEQNNRPQSERRSSFFPYPTCMPLVQPRWARQRVQPAASIETEGGRLVVWCRQRHFYEGENAMEQWLHGIRRETDRPDRPAGRLDTAFLPPHPQLHWHNAAHFPSDAVFEHCLGSSWPNISKGSNMKLSAKYYVELSTLQF